MGETLGQAIREVAKAAEASRAEGETIRAAYEAMPPEWLRRCLLVEYRCANKRGCLLLHAWSNDDAAAFYYLPDYKLSRARNEERTVESARMRNTLDGDRRWKPRAGSLDGLAEWGESIGLDVQCDHLSPVAVRAKDILNDAAKATRGRPYRRFVAARFV
jgi:hypothetical protein